MWISKNRYYSMLQNIERLEKVNQDRAEEIRLLAQKTGYEFSTEPAVNIKERVILLTKEEAEKKRLATIKQSQMMTNYFDQQRPKGVLYGLGLEHYR